MAMFEYNDKMLHNCLVSKTSELGHMFMVNEQCELQLPNDKVLMFHHIMAQLLYLCQCTQKDIQTAVVYLCTRVKRQDTKASKKLARVICKEQETNLDHSAC